MQIDLSCPSIKAFSDHVNAYCKEHDKRVSLRSSGFLRLDGGRCAGWCDGDELVVAKKNPLALEIFIHEFSHLEQSIEDSPLWNTETDYSDALMDFALKRETKRATPLTWSFQCFYNSIVLEHDCETRAIEKISEWGLPIDRTTYIQQANVYLHFYHYVFLTRKWTNSSTIYHKALVDKMPKFLLAPETFRTINMDLMNEFDSVLGVI